MRLTFAAFAVVAVLAAGVASANDRYDVHVTPGTFTVDSFEFVPEDGMPFEDGTQVRVTMRGTASKKITAGTLQFRLYESYVQHFEAEGNLPYFKCNNKGCDTAQGVTLFLANPDAERSAYTLQFVYEMGQAKKTGQFSLLMWGADQSHTPYDFSVTVGYNYTNMPEVALRGSSTPSFTAVAPSEAPEHVVVSPESITLPFQWNATNGNMTISSVTATSNTNKWEAGATVSITMKGEVPDKHILAGTLKYKIYESYVQYFIGAGNFPYFKCDNKGCDPSDGIALHLNDPTSVPTAFTMTCKIVIPKSISGGKNPFNLLLFGVDQDHYPVDFSVSIIYDLADL